MNLLDKQILKIALPAILSNITVPLLGLVDVAIVGHMGDANYIGAIAVGGMMFNLIYWVFGFLRMGTSGMTSQAYGSKQLSEVVLLLYRSLLIGLLVGALFILIQTGLLQGIFTLIDTTPAIRSLSTTYFHICIWGAPAVLGLYGLSGWFIGMQNSRFPLYIAVTQNIVNIAASLCFVYLFDMKIEGVAWGTLVAQYAGFVMGLWMWRRYYGRLRKHAVGQPVWQQKAMSRFFHVNRDIFFRTLCLVGVTLWFTASGAAQGEIILSVNTLLMQLFTLFSYVMDGFAFAGEALIGRYKGASNGKALKATVERLFRWGWGFAVLFTLLYALGGQAFLSLLTNEKEVIAASDSYYLWAVAIPFAGMAAFIWDGIFIGATATKAMLRAMLVASALFFTLFYALQSTLHNHALWLAFIVYLSARGVMQTFLWKKNGDDAKT